MKIVCVGGGPSGLCFAVLMKLRNPNHKVEVHERHEEGNTFGWGVVLSDQVINELAVLDPILAHMLLDHCIEWDEVELRIRKRVMSTSGHAYIGIGRKKLLELLTERARQLGVQVIHCSEVSSLERFADADLIIASDGINSKIRELYADSFKPDIEVRKNRFIWLGTEQKFPAFTFAFEQTEYGWFQAHAYQFEDGLSTFIVECTDETLKAHGLHETTSEDGISFCEDLFAEHLGGHPLISNARHLRGSEWLMFNRVQNESWHHGNVILLGDSAHTAHFSIGSGTRLGVGDAIDLSNSLHTFQELEDALDHYEEVRRTEVLKIQSAARNSTEWFESVKRYADLPVEQLFYALLTRSQRLGHASLKERDPTWLAKYEDWFSKKAGHTEHVAPPPMFTRFKLRDMTLQNRVVVSPMSTYSAHDGCPDSFHLVHLGARALGGPGLVITEMTAVAPEGRITPQCAGMYTDDHEQAWKKITDFVHRETATKIAIQLGHAGPRASTLPPHLGSNMPLDEGAWTTLAPSPIQAWPGCPSPHQMDVADMSQLIDQYVNATKRAHRAGFDMIEIHAAHGYLLAAFLSPLLNRRTDEFGGHLNGRLKWPLRVFDAVRSTWPNQKPISIRISATDWIKDGQLPEDSVEIARAFKAAGADIIDVSSGQTTPAERPVYGRMYQTPLSDQIRNEAGIPTMAVGNIYLPDHVNTIIASGRADLCCLGRRHLTDPNWTLRAALEQGHDQGWPRQYSAGEEQLRRLLERKEWPVTQI